MTATLPTTIPRAALVTGGAQRLGQAISIQLAQHGFDVAIHCNNSVREAEETKAHINNLGQRAVILRADLADEAQVTQLIPQSIDKLGHIGVLINNASRFDRDEWHDVTRVSWDAHIDPNLRAPFVLT